MTADDGLDKLGTRSGARIADHLESCAIAHFFGKHVERGKDWPDAKWAQEEQVIQGRISELTQFLDDRGEQIPIEPGEREPVRLKQKTSTPLDMQHVEATTRKQPARRPTDCGPRSRSRCSSNRSRSRRSHRHAASAARSHRPSRRSPAPVPLRLPLPPQPPLPPQLEFCRRELQSMSTMLKARAARDI